MNHAKRADIRTGGVPVAVYLLEEMCEAPANAEGIKKALQIWFACRGEKADSCINVYRGQPTSIYKAGKLNVQIVDVAGEADGGTKDRTCRWSSNHALMPCYLYGVEMAQGKINDDDKTGKESARTPLTKAFVSFTDPSTKTRYAVWPKVWPDSQSESGYMVWPSDTVSDSETFYRAAQGSEEVRCSPGREDPPYPTDEDHDDYEANDCAEGTCVPFGKEISNEDFSGGSMIMEGWYIDPVPYREGDTDDDRHKLEIEDCDTYVMFGASVVLCKWVIV